MTLPALAPEESAPVGGGRIPEARPWPCCPCGLAAEGGPGPAPGAGASRPAWPRSIPWSIPWSVPGSIPWSDQIGPLCTGPPPSSAPVFGDCGPPGFRTNQHTVRNPRGRVVDPWRLPWGDRWGVPWGDQTAPPSRRIAAARAWSRGAGVTQDLVRDCISRTYTAGPARFDHTGV